MATERVELVLAMLKGNPATEWVATQISETLAQGVSMSVKETLADAQFSSLVPADLSVPEKRKREKYETTRPYTSREQIELLGEALEIVYSHLPAIEIAAITELQKLGANTTRVEFVPPDEGTPISARHEIDLSSARAHQRDFSRRVSQFRQVLNDDNG